MRGHIQLCTTPPRLLNDIAMAPPELKKFLRGVKTKHNSPAGGGEKAKACAGAGVLAIMRWLNAL
jgi:hypothetical protein